MGDPRLLDDEQFARWLAVQREADEDYARRVQRERDDMLEALGWHMGTLASNLATAAGLCEAFSRGVNAAASWLSGQLDGQNAWEPGCHHAHISGAIDSASSSAPGDACDPAGIPGPDVCRFVACRRCRGTGGPYGACRDCLGTGEVAIDGCTLPSGGESKERP